MIRLDKPMYGALAAFTAASVLAMPVASAQPDCNASTMASTISSVTANLSQYFAAHPDANQALIEITRQPAFSAIGQMDGYFNDHPDQAADIRGIQAPLAAYKDRCGLQVSPTDALTALADV